MRESLSSKNGKKFFKIAGKSITDAFKTASKITIKITKKKSTTTQKVDTSAQPKELHQKKYIPPQRRQQTIDYFRIL